MSVGNRVRVLRKKLGLTQNELAKLANVTQSFVSDLENSNDISRGFSSQKLLQVSKVLNTTIDFLLTGNSE